MSEYLELTVTQVPFNDGLRRSVRLHKTGADEKEDLSLFFDLVGDTETPAPRTLDGFMFGIIFFAMEYGRPLRVHGAVSRSALLNISEFQSAWVCWRSA